jgi:hypothetical protein
VGKELELFSYLKNFRKKLWSGYLTEWRESEIGDNSTVSDFGMFTLQQILFSFSNKKNETLY